MATEAVFFAIRPHIVVTFWNKFIINEHELIDMPGDSDYLLLGDSIQKTAIIPAMVSGDLLSLGLPGAKPASLYLLLSRYLERHRPPKAVFLFIDPQNVHQAMHLVLKYFVTAPEAAYLWKDLTWDERGHFLLRYWTSLDERVVSAPVKEPYTRPNAVFVEEMMQNRGYMPLPHDGKSIEDNHFALTGDRPEASISTEKRDFIYLDKIVTLARARGIKIILLGNVLPRELHDRAEKTGFNREWLFFLDVIKKRYPDIELVNEPILYLENRYFCDMSHLNRDGRLIYTEYFKKQVFIPFTEGPSRITRSDGEAP